MALGVARTAVRWGIESRIVKLALAVAAIVPSVPALAQRHEEDRRPHGAAAISNPREQRAQIDTW